MKGFVIKALSFLFLATVFAVQAESSPIPIDSINQAAEDLQNSDSHTLIVFDVDETLTCNFDTGFFIIYEPKDVPDKDKNFILKARQQFFDYLTKIGSDAMNEMINSFYLSKGTGQPVELSTVRIIRELQAKKIKLIALTAMPADAFGSISCGRTLRYDTLRKQGIDFSSSFSIESIHFNNLKKYKNGCPMFYKGILFSNYKNDKGIVLGAFFDSIGWTPKKILFFDDSWNRVEEVLKEMEKRSIPCHGYWYQAAQHAAKPPFDRQTAAIQLDQLISHNRLLTASEAKAIDR